MHVKAVRVEDFPTGESGVAMVEATIGTMFLLFAALVVIQFTLIFHGALAAHSAASRTARVYALWEDETRTESEYDNQTSTSLKALVWEPPDCHLEPKQAVCAARVTIPTVLPGVGIFSGGSLLSAYRVEETGYYPRGGVYVPRP